MPTHTPTPWRVGKDGSCVVADVPIPEVSGSEHVEYYGGHLVAESITPTNAAFIVRACNVHDELLAACQAAIAWSALDGDGLSDPVRQQILDAIATAEG